MRRGGGKGGVLPDTEQVGGYSGSLSSVSGVVRMQGRTPRTPREPQDEEAEPRPRLPGEVAGFLSQVPCRARPRSQVRRLGAGSLSPWYHPDLNAAFNFPHHQWWPDSGGRGPSGQPPPRGHQAAGRSAGQGREVGTAAARPAAWVSRLTTRCPQTDPDKAFLQPRLKHKTWGGVGLWARGLGIGGAILPASLGPAPCCPAGRSHQRHTPVTNLSPGARRSVASASTGDQEMEPTPGILPLPPGRPPDFGPRGPWCGQPWL